MPCNPNGYMMINTAAEGARIRVSGLMGVQVVGREFAKTVQKTVVRLLTL